MTDNICSGGLDDVVYNLSGFCTMAGSNDNARSDACYNIGNGSGEWSFTSRGDSCNYNSCNDRQEMGRCDGGCCPIVGRGVSCTRNTFKGDPWACCLRDYACSGSFDHCFTDSSHRRTCPPEYRDLGTTGCRNLFEDVCAGSNDSTKSWRSLWTQTADNISQSPGITIPPGMDYPCLKLFYRGMYNGTSISCNPGLTPNSTVPPSADGFVWSQALFYKVFNKYLEEGGRPDGNESTPGVDVNFNDTLYNICKSYPGMCASTLQSYCSQYTTQDLVYNLDALKWCGCYMPTGEYSKYSDRYQVNPECTPTCNRNDTIPLPSNVGVGQKYCQQTLCIIDDVSIALVQSQVGSDGSGIQFNQLCSTCGGGSTSGSYTSSSSGDGSTTNNGTSIIRNNVQSTCSCTLSDISIIGVGAKIGDIGISQHCAGTTCYSTVPAPGGGTTTVPVSCNADNAIDAGLSQGTQNSLAYKKAEMTKRTYMIIVAIVLIIAIIVIGYIFGPRNNIQEDIISSKINIRKLART